MTLKRFAVCFATSLLLVSTAFAQKGPSGGGRVRDSASESQAVHESFNQKGGGRMAMTQRLLKGSCNGDIAISFDEASVGASFAKLSLPSTNTSSGQTSTLSNRYTADAAMSDAEAGCNGAVSILKHVCDMNEANSPGAVASKVKTVRCVVLDGRDAAPQQEFKDGTWTVKYSLWVNGNELRGDLASGAKVPSLEVGLASALGLPAPDEYAIQHHADAGRCTSAKDCGAGKVCGRAGAPARGPHCVDAGSVECTRGGSAFGHADSKCPSGQWCSQAGVCFAKAEFPTEGHGLRTNATCYYARECASSKCVSQGGNRFSDRVGSCGRN